MKNFKLFLTLFLITILAVPAWGVSYTITFLDNGTSSDGSAAKTAKADIIDDGEDYVSSISDATKVYQAQTDYGVKLGSSSAIGYFTINFSTSGQVNPTKIIVNARYYGTDSSSKLEYKINGGSKSSKTITDAFANYEISMDGETTITSLYLGSSTKRIYIKSVTIEYGSGSSKVATPTFTPAAGSYSSAQSVTISCTTSGATIHYTTDGSTPTSSSPTYTGAIPVSSTTTIKAIAEKSGMTNSDVASATYTITASCSADITLSFKGGSHTSSWTNCTLPTASDIADEDKCDGWDFVGWSETEITSTTTAPTLITEKSSDGTVYAVYRQGGGGEAIFNFASLAAANSWTDGSDGNQDITINGVNIQVTKGTASNWARWWADDQTWRIYKNNTVTITSSVGDITDVTTTPTTTFTISGNTATLSPSSTVKFKTITVTAGSGSGATYTTYCNMISSTELEIVEWNPDYINIMVPDPENASVIIEDKNEHKTTPIVANDIFMSKYFEASSNVKMIGIFNGTGVDKDVSDLRIRIPWINSSTTTGISQGNYSRYVVLSTVLNTAGRSTTLANGDEIILYSYQPSALSNGTCYRDLQILDSAAAQGVDMSNWIPITYAYNSSSTDPADYGGTALCFGGREPILLERNTSGSIWEPIDIIGAVDASGNAIYGGTESTWGDGKGWVCTTGKSIKDTTEVIGISTNRCLLVRKFSVRDGSNAVASNKGTSATFATLCSEWYGFHVDAEEGSGSGCNKFKDDSHNSAVGFTYVGSYDYSDSYQQYEHVATVTDFDVSNLNPDGSYRVDIPQLDTLACTKLKIILTGTTPATNFYDVPIMVEAGKATTDAIFHNYNKTEEICKTCDVVILKNATLTKATDGVANDVPEVRNVTIYPGGELIVPFGTNYKVNSVRFRVEDEDVPGAKLKGTITSTMDSVYVTRRINNSRYYFMSVPYACKVNDIRWSNGEAATHGTDFIIREYNSQKRANNGWCSGASSNWDPVDDDATLQPMKGYIVAVGTDYKSELVFPMKVDNTDLTTDEDNKTNTVTISEYTSSKTINNHNWNFIAQPYVCKLTPGEDADITVGKIANSTGKQDGWYYDDGGNEYLTFYVPSSNDYDQTILSSAPSLDPFLAFFVQAQSGGGSYEFEKANRINSAPARRYAAKSEYTDESIFVGVTLSGNGGKDQTNLRIRPDFNEEYQLGYDLAKFSTTSEKRPIIYMRNGIYDLAFRALNDNNAAMSQPMGVYCKAAGTYTFALSNDYSRENIEAVYLYDAETQQTINLMNDTYEFTTTGNLNTGERFYLSAVVRRPAPQVTTDNELVNEELPLTRKILINGHVFIQHGGKLFDITGKEMLNH